MRVILLLCFFILFSYSKESFKVEKKVNIEKDNEVSAKVTLYLDQNIDKVFHKILNYKKYPKYINDVSKVDIYLNSRNIIKIKLIATIFFIDISNHFIHYIDRENYTIKWHLDKNKDNLLNYSQGTWSLLKTSTNKTIVTYKNKLGLPSSIPTFLSSYIGHKGIINASTWLLKE